MSNLRRKLHTRFWCVLELLVLIRDKGDITKIIER
jgi:hypothetical protein